MPIRNTNTPVISVSSHEMTAYTHNVVARFVDLSQSHIIEFCTYVSEPRSLGVQIEIETHLQRTLHILSPVLRLNEYTYQGITWTDDI